MFDISCQQKRTHKFLVLVIKGLRTIAALDINK